MGQVFSWDLGWVEMGEAKNGDMGLVQEPWADSLVGRAGSLLNRGCVWFVCDIFFLFRNELVNDY